MISLKKVTITRKSEEGFSGVFSISPLPAGFGSTFGTILRRTLLSSIPGYGITSVKINGVSHEYSTLKGVQDDVLSILLSLKNITFAGETLEPVELHLSKKGKNGEVTDVIAGDFEKNSFIKIINPEYVITRISTNETLDITIKVERGYGYHLPKDNKRTDIDVLPMDVNYSPVTLVTYDVESARVGKDTNLDELVLQIKTNGAVSPDEALKIAIDTLTDGFSHLNLVAQNIVPSDSKAIKLNDQEKESAEIAKATIQNNRLMSVVDMNLSTRLTNALLRSGIDDLSKLNGMSSDEVASIRGLGSKSHLELLEVIKKYGINLK